MKQIALMAIAIPLMMAASFAQAPTWSNLTIDQAVAKAKNEGKFLMLFVTSDCCAPCVNIEKQVFYSENFYGWDDQTMIAVKVQPDTSLFRTNSYLQGLYSIPAAILIYPDGELYSNVTDVSLKEYLGSYVTSFVSDYDYHLRTASVKNRLSQLSNEYLSGKRDVNFLQTLLTEFKDAENNYYIYDYEYGIYLSTIADDYFRAVTPDVLFSTEQGFRLYYDYEQKITSPRTEYIMSNMDNMYLKYGSDVTTKLRTLLKTELYNMGVSKDSYGIGLLEKTILPKLKDKTIKTEFSGFFKRIKDEMKKDNVDYYYWNDSYNYYDY